MTLGEGDMIGRARHVIATRITAEHPGWQAGHDAYGWLAYRLDDGHTVRATGPDGLRAMIGAAPPFPSWRVLGEIRRAYPDWHVWRDATGWWHARRRGNFREVHRPGAPRYAVYESDPALLCERLDEQKALDQAAG
jgi:hypothetical protein